MIKGYVINNLGRGKHIFKRSVPPGMKVPLDQLYELYSKNYEGKFDTEFIDWLEKTKIPKGSGFDIVLEAILPDDIKDTETGSTNIPETISFLIPVESAQTDPEPEPEIRLPPPRKMTSRQIADLKIKDNPKIVLQHISSVHKLRRALTLCKDKPGKETLSRLIRERMTEIS